MKQSLKPVVSAEEDTGIILGFPSSEYKNALMKIRDMMSGTFDEDYKLDLDFVNSELKNTEDDEKLRPCGLSIRLNKWLKNIKIYDVDADLNKCVWKKEHLIYDIERIYRKWKNKLPDQSKHYQEKQTLNQTKL